MSEYTVEEVEVRLHQKVDRAKQLKALAEQKDIRFDKLTKDLNVVTVWVPPYTMVKTEIEFDDQWYWSIAFAKANPNADDFERGFGHRLCLHRCIHNIATYIATGKKAYNVYGEAIGFFENVDTLRLIGVHEEELPK